MPLFKIEVHVHVHGDNDNESGNIAAELRKLKQFMGQEFDQLKAQLDATNTKLDEAGTAIATAAAGLKTDIDGLKQQLADMAGGATLEQIAEATATANAIAAKTDNVVALAQTLTSLDAETPQS